MKKCFRTLICVVFWVLPGWAAPTPVEQDRYRFPSVVAKKGMVVSAEPLATQAGLQVLKNGGNAVDAAVVTGLVMAVTLPRAGNIGGGGFMLIRSPKGEVFSLDFRERAPAASQENMLQDSEGNRDVDKATIGALCVGIPGTVAGFEMALKRYGTIPWNQAVEPARQLAQEGFVVPAWLTAEVERVRPGLSRFSDSRKVFFPSGRPLPTGLVWKQPDLARTLQAIQKQGSKGFYQGEVAERLVASIQRHGGIMTLADLKNYKPRWCDPVRGTYRGYDIYSMGPPSSGGVHLIQALNVLEGFPMGEAGLNSALNLHRQVETLRQCYADRSEWLGDPAFVKVPVEWLTSKEYAAKIRSQIPERKARSSSEVKPGQPLAYESTQTTHFCTVDKEGWAVSLTYTLNFSYGSGLVAEDTGVLLNNEMDDFSAAPGKPNGFGLVGGKANSIEPGKGPLSSMTPTVVQKQGQLVAVVGSPGGSRIITAVLQVILNLIDFDLNAQTAVCECRLHHQWLPDQVDLEQGFSPDTIALLKAWGHKVVNADSLGHVMLIRRREDGLFEGGADPRRTGGAMDGY
ncbi:gamma-glutamyltransferase [bacterium]|nr:gamma-glutamyltransferase [bacterium]